VAAALGVVLPPDLPSELFPAYARRADELGLDELWVFEDCFLRGGIAQASVALSITSRIRVGVGILPAGARNVAFASLDISTLAELFPGRLMVGIGHGMPVWMRQVGAWPASPVTLLEEYIAALRSILSGRRTTVDGRYVTVRDVELHRPPDVAPPVFAGVRGPKSLAASGRVADGTILAEPTTPEYLCSARAHIGVGGETHEIVAYNVGAVHDSAPVARDRARHGLQWIGEKDWAPHLAGLPFAAELAELRARAGDREEFARRLPDEWVDQLAVVGTPDQVGERLAMLAEAGAQHLVLNLAGPDPLDSLDALARVLKR
jgi:alkanesulfonate monooxygenase SsuD/methylene tetrahydromethanopterin reductase-like flavin-dependent oxidoreductase (luciferase family)